MKNALAARSDPFAASALLLGAFAAAQAPTSPPTPSQQPTSPAQQEPRPLFTDPTDGAFDVSGFLATRQGLLPLVVPITEPAIGYGAGVGLAFRHDELRYDFAPRWSLLVFGGSGRVADSFGDLWTATDRPAGGTGFRYMIAREYGISLGVDVAYGDDDIVVYVGVGAGWPRP
jgi:hypothetical protein